MPRNEFSMGKKATGAKKIAKLCKTFAIPPDVCEKKKTIRFFLSKTPLFAKISFRAFLLKRKNKAIKNTNSLIHMKPCQKSALV